MFYHYLLDIEEFVDLKSVSTFGWRVDIERLRSKYFVDLMKDKTEERAATAAQLGGVGSIIGGGEIGDKRPQRTAEEEEELKKMLNGEAAGVATLGLMQGGVNGDIRSQLRNFTDDL
jgi:hypothetical protein